MYSVMKLENMCLKVLHRHLPCLWISSIFAWELSLQNLKEKPFPDFSLYFILVVGVVVLLEKIWIGLEIFCMLFKSLPNCKTMIGRDFQAELDNIQVLGQNKSQGQLPTSVWSSWVLDLRGGRRRKRMNAQRRVAVTQNVQTSFAVLSR